MRRTGSVVFLAVYVTALVWTTLAHAQSPAPGQTFSDWVLHSMDWHSFGAATLCGLAGGVGRTLGTLRSMQPTFRVFLETVGDAFTALINGSLMFLALLVFQFAAEKPVPHWATFILSVAAGWLRGGFISLMDDTIKRVLAAIADGFVSWVASKSTAWLAKKAEGEKS